MAIGKTYEQGIGGWSYNVTVAPPTPEERAAEVAKQHAAIEGIAAAARRFLSIYDEFWDNYPAAVGEDLDALIDAIDKLGD